jgi:hypothetical protein
MSDNDSTDLPYTTGNGEEDGYIDGGFEGMMSDGGGMVLAVVLAIAVIVVIIVYAVETGKITNPTVTSKYDSAKSLIFGDK